MKKYHHITLFLPNAATLRFIEVTNVEVKEHTLSFDYVSASDGMKNSGTVNLRQIVMVAYAEVL